MLSSSDWIDVRKTIALLGRSYALCTQSRYRPLLYWFGGSAAVSVMWAWDWQLVLATGAGMGCLALVYAVPPSQWQYWRSLVVGLSRKMPLAVGLAGIAALSTYLVSVIWAESDNHWLAIASIVQGLVTATTLGLLIWQAIAIQQQQGRDRYEQWLQELTASEPIRRLMAVRQLSERATHKELNPSQFQQLIEYFTLILAQETEDSVRRAIFESLQLWQVQIKTNRVAQPLQLPIRERSPIPRPVAAD